MIERVRLNDKSNPRKIYNFERKRPPGDKKSFKYPTELPDELNIKLDRRTGTGKILYDRLVGYIRQITGDGRRPLRATEVASLKVIVLLEQKIDAQFDPYHQDEKLNAEELKGLSSELRRQLCALGLDGPRATHESAPVSKERKSRKPDDAGWVEKLCKRIETLARHGRENQEPDQQPAPDKARNRKRRRPRKQKRPAAPKPEQEDDRHIKEGVRRAGAWFPSDRYPREF